MTPAQLRYWGKWAFHLKYQVMREAWRDAKRAARGSVH